MRFDGIILPGNAARVQLAVAGQVGSTDQRIVDCYLDWRPERGEISRALRGRS